MFLLLVKHFLYLLDLCLHPFPKFWFILQSLLFAGKTGQLMYNNESRTCSNTIAVVQPPSHVQLCDSTDCSTSGSPFLHYLLEFDQIHVHWVGDAISNHLIFCHALLLLLSIFPSIRVFSNELALHIRWYFSFRISPSMVIQGWFPLELTGLISFQSTELSGVFSSTTIWKHEFFGAQPSSWSNSHIHTWLLKNHSSNDTGLCNKSDISAF